MRRSHMIVSNGSTMPSIGGAVGDPHGNERSNFETVSTHDDKNFSRPVTEHAPYRFFQSRPTT